MYKFFIILWTTELPILFESILYICIMKLTTTLTCSPLVIFFKGWGNKIVKESVLVSISRLWYNLRNVPQGTASWVSELVRAPYHTGTIPIAPPLPRLLNVIRRERPGRIRLERNEIQPTKWMDWKLKCFVYHPQWVKFQYYINNWFFLNVTSFTNQFNFYWVVIGIM